MPRTPAALTALAASLALAACASEGSSSPGGALCTTLGLSVEFVHPVTLDWYLHYPEYLPDPVPDPAAYSDPQELLDALTALARADGKDRHWSYVASYSAVMSYYAGGPSVGFGFSLQFRGDPLFVAQVMEGSAADDEGFLRGDEILSISDGETVLWTTGGTAEELAAAIGPSTAGVTRTFEVAPVGGGENASRTMAKRAYTLDPVRFDLLDRGTGVPPTGYVNLLTFIEPAEDQLREAFAAFRAAGVVEVIVDLRYNGGGLVDTAVVLANLLGGGLGGEVMFGWYLNEAHLAETPPPELFAPEADSVQPLRIAFVTTRASASASELVVNALEPHAEVAIVGDRTYGKPVGQLGFVLESCDLLLGLIAFGLENADGDGAYFDGLPDPDGRYTGAFCPAEDDLSHEMGDPLEASTAAALHFLDAGGCPAPEPAALRTSLLRTSAGAVHPTAAEPTPAQRDVAGLF
jgi:C-terminal processing protease CtpA/Prc